MMIFYMDDTGEGGRVGFVALGIPATSWKGTYETLVEFRRRLMKDHGIPFSAELHAAEFIGGRTTAGRAVRDASTRLEIFNEMLSVANSIPGATILCAFDQAHYEGRLYERLMNRINVCVTNKETHAIIISDEGKDKRLRALARKLGKHNPIPSQYGAWHDGKLTRNIPNDAILEDVIFRSSEQCRLIQLADFCAYALLRSEIGHPTKPELSECFGRMDSILNKQAFGKDPRGLGIIRGA